ncbi:MAG: hypothetical protein ACREC6_00875 [Hyphomicrobiaceae bacterium]
MTTMARRLGPAIAAGFVMTLTPQVFAPVWLGGSAAAQPAPSADVEAKRKADAEAKRKAAAKRKRDAAKRHADAGRRLAQKQYEDEELAREEEYRRRDEQRTRGSQYRLRDDEREMLDRARRERAAAQARGDAVWERACVDGRGRAHRQTSVEAEIACLRAALTEARERGDTAAEDRIADRLRELRWRREREIAAGGRQPGSPYARPPRDPAPYVPPADALPPERHPESPYVRPPRDPAPYAPPAETLPPERESRDMYGIPKVHPPATPATHVTVLLTLESSDRGVNPLGHDPILCLPPVGCYVSNGSTEPAFFRYGRKAFGLFGTIGPRAGACNNSSTCVFRGVDLSYAEGRALQPIDMRLFRHDRREIVTVDADSGCHAVRDGRLVCKRAYTTFTYRMWIVPEEIAEHVGPEGLEAALADGLPTRRAGLE